jgi:hypothetical protein
MKYVLLFVDTEQFSNDLRAMSQAERDRAYERVHQWLADNARAIRGGSKLRPPNTATTVGWTPVSRSLLMARSLKAKK